LRNDKDQTLKIKTNSIKITFKSMDTKKMHLNLVLKRFVIYISYLKYSFSLNLSWFGDLEFYNLKLVILEMDLNYTFLF